MEMVTGKCPFRTTAAKNFYRELKGVDPPGGNADSYRAATCSMTPDFKSSSSLTSPEGLECADMCRGLLEVNPRRRLGCSEVSDFFIRFLKLLRFFFDTRNTAFMRVFFRFRGSIVKGQILNLF
jgi:hypothetical protein